MEKEQLEILKQKMDLVADIPITYLQSALNYYNSLKKNQHTYYETYRKKPEIKEKLNEYAKIKMRELRARRKAEKQAQQI